MTTRAAELQHQVIELAKASYKADGCDMTFEGCLELHAKSMVKPPFRYAVGERNGVWSFDVWLGNERSLGDRI